jgi:hypothetical protein
MTPRPHRRRSSKESPARDYNASEVAALLYSDALEISSRVLSTVASFPTSDRRLAYGYQSCHSGGAAIGR